MVQNKYNKLGIKFRNNKGTYMYSLKYTSQGYNYEFEYI